MMAAGTLNLHHARIQKIPSGGEEVLTTFLVLLVTKVFFFTECPTDLHREHTGPERPIASED